MADRSNLRAKMLAGLTKAGGKRMDMHGQMNFISTGSMVMDSDLDGGYPKQTITEMFGPPGTGKTTLAMLAAKNVMLNGSHVMFMNVERQISLPKWSRRLGVPVDGVDDNGDPLLDVIVPPTAEFALQTLIDCLREDMYDLYIVDSVAKITPTAEIESDLSKPSQLGLQARLMAAFCRRVGDPLFNSSAALLAINQVRADIGTYGGGYTSPGGYALHHEVGLRLQFLSSKEVWRGGNTRDVIDQLIIRWKMKKSKITDFNEVAHEVVLERQDDGSYAIDGVKEVFDLGKRFGVFRGTNYLTNPASSEPWSGRGSCYFVQDGNPVNLGIGEAAVRASIAQDYSLFCAIRDAVKGKLEQRPNESTEEISQE